MSGVGTTEGELICCGYHRGIAAAGERGVEFVYDVAPRM